MKDKKRIMAETQRRAPAALRLSRGALHAEPGARRVGQYRHPALRSCQRPLGARLMEEPGEFARVRRLHPAADEDLLRRLPEDFACPIRRRPAKTLEIPRSPGADAFQCRAAGPQKGLLAEDLDAELDRFIAITSNRRGRAALRRISSTRNGIRTRANQVFRSAGIWPRLDRRLRVDEFTYAGRSLAHRLRLPAQWHAGLRAGLPLSRDPGQAKVLAFTADAIRARSWPTPNSWPSREAEPRPQENPRHRFVTGLLAERGDSRGAAVPPGGMGLSAAADTPRQQQLISGAGAALDPAER